MIIIFYREKASYGTALFSVLQRLQDRGKTLNDNYEFDVPPMNILGYVIDEHVIRPNDELVTGIVEAAVPENKQQVRSFLGLAAFYAKCVSNFSTKVSTMRDVQNIEPFYWTEDAYSAFRDIKSNIVNSPGLTSDFGRCLPKLKTMVRKSWRHVRSDR